MRTCRSSPPSPASPRCAPKTGALRVAWTASRAGRGRVAGPGPRELSRRQAGTTPISTMGDGLILLDAERRAVEINRTAELLLGVRRRRSLACAGVRVPWRAARCATSLPRWSRLATPPTRAPSPRPASAPSPAAFPHSATAPATAGAGDRAQRRDRPGGGEPAEDRVRGLRVARTTRAPHLHARFCRHPHLPEAATLPEGEAQEFLQIIRGEADRCLRLISRLLNVSNRESGRGLELFPVPLDMVALAHRAVEASQALSSKHTLRIEAEEPCRKWKRIKTRSKKCW